MKYDGMLFGNGLTLNLLYQLQPKIPKGKRYLLNIDDFLKAWLSGNISAREERIIYSSIYGNRKDKWNFFDIIKDGIKTYYQEFDANIEYAMGALLFKESQHRNIIQIFPALYNVWYIILKDYLNYIGLSEEINNFYRSVKEITGKPSYIWTTNFDLFGEALMPQHLHGKFLERMKGYEDVRYKMIEGEEEYYYKYIWGPNGIGKAENIRQLKEYRDHKNFFDFDFFYDDKFCIENILVFGMGFKNAGFIDDLKTKFERYETPVFGAIIDEHILVRLKGLQNLRRLKNIDITYFDDKEKIHLENVLKEVGITKYRLLKCQDFKFSI